MDNENKEIHLCMYRINNAVDTLDTAKLCMEYKRHKDAVAYFNQHYVATEIFDREIGKRLGRLKRKREASDYDDFYVASFDEAKEQYESAELIVKNVQTFLKRKKILT